MHCRLGGIDGWTGGWVDLLLTPAEQHSGPTKGVSGGRGV